MAAAVPDLVSQPGFAEAFLPRGRAPEVGELFQFKAAARTLRLIAERLSTAWGQQVLVENVGGAGGVTGSSRVARAAPDGYQFVQGGTGTHAQSQTLYKNPAYNAVTDFAPLALITMLVAPVHFALLRWLSRRFDARERAEFVSGALLDRADRGLHRAKPLCRYVRHVRRRSVRVVRVVPRPVAARGPTSPRRPRRPRSSSRRTSRD